MYIYAVAALAAALLLQPPIANAREADADAAARSYFAHACADKRERVAVYAPDAAALTDITTAAAGGSAAWDRFRFERLCARPKLYIYHCHTTDDVLTPFPSGSKGGAPGDFGTAAEMEFTCAKMAALNDHPVASLVHGLVTPRGAIVKYGFTAPTLDKIRAQGREFARLLREARPRPELEQAQAEAQAAFDRFNALHYDSFIAFAVKTCPTGDIEHCRGLTIERFAGTLSGDDWRFIRVGADPAPRGGPDAAGQGPSLVRSLSDLDDSIREARVPHGITELTPDTLGAFVADGKAMVSICAKEGDGLLPCRQAKARIDRLAAACDRVKTGILDQDKYPRARYVYPAAKDRSLLLFAANPRSGLNERFDLSISGEPTAQLIGMVLCGNLPFAMPSFSP